MSKSRDNMIEREQLTKKLQTLLHLFHSCLEEGDVEKQHDIGDYTLISTIEVLMLIADDHLTHFDRAYINSIIKKFNLMKKWYS